MFAGSAVALHIVHRLPPLPVARAVAISAARSNPFLRTRLHAGDYDRVVVDRVDARNDRVAFYSGAKIQAEVEVEVGGTSSASLDFRLLNVPYGNWLAYLPEVVAGLAALFVLMTAVAPWRRLRNLDVAAVLSLVAPVGLLQARYIDASVLAAVPGLGYLCVRCAWIGLGRPRSAGPSVSLWSLATAALAPAVRLRLLRIVLLSLAAIVLMVGVSSSNAVDVIYAVMEGATNLVHGLLPYGHMPSDVVHGDTYPILSYLLYVPLALLAPVTSRWDSVDPALALGGAAAIGTALAVGGRGLIVHRRRAVAPRSPEELESGLRAAVAWLAFPPLLVTVSTGTTDVVLAAMLVGAVAAWRRPALCSAVVTAAAWFKLAPAALLVFVFAPLRGRERTRPVLAAVAVSAPLVALLAALGGLSGIGAMARAVAFQFSRGSEQSLWVAAGLRAWQPLGQAGVLALLAASAIRLRREPALASDRRRMAALSAAVLIGLELAGNYWAFLYVVWVVPLVMVSVLAPGRGEAALARAEAARDGALADAAPA